MQPGHLEALWGAIVDRADWDVTGHFLAMTILVSSPVGQTVRTLECSGVGELRFFSSIPRPWEYAEITEIHARTTPAGAHQIEFVLWSEDAGLVVTAETITLDGEHITS
jgi:hypothetical protein